MTASRRSVLAAVAGAMAAALLFSLATAYDARATHEPANKGAAAGSDIDTVGDDSLLLSETMRVSSPEDLIISVTAECSILTELTTGPSAAGTGGTAASDNAFAFGSVRLRVEIDGKEVPVASDESAASEDDAADDDNEIGEVTFCNRAYERTVTDGEDDGLDEEHDYIRTRTANAFNWLALDTGVVYDDAVIQNGNNIILVELFADYDTDTAGDALADAFVGSRTMIIEPVRLSIHETVQSQEPVAPQRGKGR